MLPDELRHLTVIPFRALIESTEQVPQRPGVYLFFLRGGTALLQATSYFEFGRRDPISLDGMTHVYTGAARFLRDRLRQHAGSDTENSSIRKTLLSIESKFGAISNSGTPLCHVKGHLTLTSWLCENAAIAIENHSRPFARERVILNKYASPFNIAHRREDPYARALSAWRCAVFPKNADPYRTLRHV